MALFFAFYLSLSGVEVRVITPYETMQECEAKKHQEQYTAPSNLVYLGGYCEETPTV